MNYSSYMVVEYYWNGKYASLYEVPTLEWGHVEMANVAIYIRYIFFRPGSPQQASTSLKGPPEQHGISFSFILKVLSTQIKCSLYITPTHNKHEGLDHTHRASMGSCEMKELKDSDLRLL